MPPTRGTRSIEDTRGLGGESGGDLPALGLGGGGRRQRVTPEDCRWEGGDSVRLACQLMSEEGKEGR